MSYVKSSSTREIVKAALTCVLTLIFLVLNTNTSTAQINVENTTVTTADNVSTVTLPHTVSIVSTENLLMVGISTKKTNNPVPTVTYGGVTMEFVTNVNNNGAADGKDGELFMYSLIDPPTGNNDVVVDFNGILQDKGIVVGATSFSGVSPLVPYNNLSTNTGDSNTPSVNVLGTTSDELIYDVVSFKNSGTLTVGANQTQRFNQIIDEMRGASSTEPGNGGTVTMSWTPANSNKWSIAAVALQPVPCVYGTVTVTNVTTEGGSDGEITVSDPNGATNYQYRLDTGSWQSGNTFTGLSAGTYDVQIRDADNPGTCEVSLGFYTVIEPDPDLPTATANLEDLPNGSLVVPMDHLLQNIGASAFNLRAYGYLNLLLHNDIPLKWVIKTGKVKDGVDLDDASVFEVRPTTTETAADAAPVDIRGSAFVILPQYANEALTIAASDFPNVRVYKLAQPYADADVRYTLTHKPQISVSTGANPGIHTSILAAAGFVAAGPGDDITDGVHYYQELPTNIPSGACRTIHTEPHWDHSLQDQADALIDFAEQGGNVLAQCVAVVTYETLFLSSSVTGKSQTNEGILDAGDLNDAVEYTNPDLAFSQYTDPIDFTEGGSVSDWRFFAPPDDYINGGHSHAQNLDDPNDPIIMMSQHKIPTLVSGADGGNIFYLGGHDYSANTLGQINARRAYLNAVMMPAAQDNNCTFDLTFYSLSGRVFLDANTNANLDTGENGFSGVTVTITDPNNNSTVVNTDADGFWDLSVQDTGTYTITVTRPADYFITTANRVQTVTVNSGDTIIEADDVGLWNSRTIELTGGSCWRTLSNPKAGLNWQTFFAAFETDGTSYGGLWTQGATGSSYPSGDANVFTLNADGSDWIPVTDLTQIIPAGTGILMSVFADDDFDGPAPGTFGTKTATFDGTENSPVLVTLADGNANPLVGTTSSPGDDNPDYRGFSMMGNPFFAPISFAEVYANTGTKGIVEAAWVYDRNAGGGSGGWISTNGTGVGDIANGVIASGQGFVVQNTNPTSAPTVDFEENDIATGETFYGKLSEQRLPDHLRLEIRGEGVYNSAWIQFSREGTTSERTKGDVLQFYPFESEYAVLSTMKSGDLMDIGHFPTLTSGDDLRIPLIVETTSMAPMTLELTDLQLAGTTLFLHDTETGETIELTEGATYTFTPSGTPAKSMNDCYSTPVSFLGPQQNAKQGGSRFFISAEASVGGGSTDLPSEFTLSQNYPNPFNPSTQITYQLPVQSDVRLQVFDMAGRQVATLVNENVSAGTHTVNFNATNLSSGVYMYRLQAGSNIMTKKLTLIK